MQLVDDPTQLEHGEEHYEQELSIYKKKYPSAQVLHKEEEEQELQLSN